MPVNQIALAVSSFALAALLPACQCHLAAEGPKAGKGGAGQGAPAEDALERLNAGVTRDPKRPGNPVVEVRVFKEDVTDADLKVVAQFPQLRKLVAGGKEFTGTAFKDLAGLPLEGLDLRFAHGVTDEGLREIAKIKTLKALRLGSGKYTDAGLAVLAALEKMEELGVSSFEAKDVGLSKALARMKKLRVLDVNNSSVGDGAMEKAAASNPELRVLHLYGSSVTQAGYKYVGRMKQLVELRCSYSIEDTGLAALAGLPELRKLSVWNSNVTFDAIRKSPLLKQLTDLGLGGALSRITPEQTEQLRKLAPDCNISTR